MPINYSSTTITILYVCVYYYFNLLHYYISMFFTYDFQNFNILSNNKVLYIYIYFTES